MKRYSKLDSMFKSFGFSLFLLAVIAAMILFLSGCSSSSHKPLQPEIETLTVERCYTYQYFTSDQWDGAIKWITNEQLDSVPAMMMEDYIRLRSINECKDDQE